MYERYWLLNAKPFDAFAGPEYFCQIATQQQVAEKLRYGIVDRPGCGRLIGHSGTGKTTFAAEFTRLHTERFEQQIWIRGPHFDASDLIGQIHRQLVPAAKDVRASSDRAQKSAASVMASPMASTQQWMQIQQQLQQAGQSVLFVLDDSQTLRDPRVADVLKSLFELNRVATPGSQMSTGSSRGTSVGDNPERRFACISLLCLMQPSVEAGWMQSWETADLFTMNLVLPRLSFEETDQYIRDRMRIAGSQANCFSSQAVEQIFRSTGGSLRKINQLADLSLLVGYVRRAPQISPDDVLQAAGELMLTAAA